jgi:hypothetical protein
MATLVCRAITACTSIERGVGETASYAGREAAGQLQREVEEEVLQKKKGLKK